MIKKIINELNLFLINHITTITVKMTTDLIKKT